MKPKNATPSPFSARLRELRATAKMTQQEVADHLEIQRSTYAYYETGAIEPPLSLLQRLATEFRVTVGYLLGGDEIAATLPMRQDNSAPSQENDPLDGARLMGECDREERAFLSVLRRLDTPARNKLRDLCHELLQENTTPEELEALASAHIHPIDELFKKNDE